MRKPDPKKFLGCPAEVRRYIAELESSLESVLQINEMFATSGMETERKLLAMENAASWHSKNQPSQLDQFAMAAIDRCILGAANACAIGKITEEEIFELSAKYAYRIAEAMQAESQKRQGGAA